MKGPQRWLHVSLKGGFRPFRLRTSFPAFHRYNWWSVSLKVVFERALHAGLSTLISANEPLMPVNAACLACERKWSTILRAKARCGMQAFQAIIFLFLHSSLYYHKAKNKLANAHFTRLCELLKITQTLFRVRFFMLLYCYFVSKPYHSDTVSCLVNMVSKLLYPNCTHHKFGEHAS